MNNKHVYVAGFVIIIIIIILGVFQYNRFEDLKEKTLYFNRNNFQRIYYFIRYHLFQEAHKGGIDLIKVDVEKGESYDYAEPLKVAKTIKQQNVMAEQVLLAKANAHKNSVELFFYDSTLIKAQYNEENQTIIKALNSFKNLIPTGESFGEDYSVRLSDKRILLVEPIVNAKNNEVLGFVGIVFTSNLVAKNVLPKVFETYNFPEDSSKYVIQVIDFPEKNVLFSNAPKMNLKNEKPDYTLPIAFVFNNWMVEIYLIGSSIEDTALKAFYQNIAISALTLIALFIGILFIFRTAQKEKQLSQMKSDFIANISHELKTPLSVIQVAGENLKNNKIAGNDRLQQYGTFIHNESKRLVRLVDKILNSANIESGNYTYNFTESDINAIIKDICSSLEIQLKNENFSCRIDLDDTIPKIKIDTTLIKEVLYNLIDNAVKYSNNIKEAKISSRVINNEVQIVIEDKGIGISKKDQKFIFDKFYRGGKATIHNTKGSGLGLSLSKKIIEAHQGKITFESEPKKGSKFTVHLNLV